MNRHDRRAVLKVLRRTRLLDNIDAHLNSSPGPDSSITTETVLFALIATAGTAGGIAARLDRATGVLRRLQPDVWADLRLPDDLPFADDHPARPDDPERRRVLNRRLYQRFHDKLERIGQWMMLKTDGVYNAARLADALITASLPKHARQYNSLVFDSAPVKAAEYRWHESRDGRPPTPKFGPSLRIRDDEPRSDKNHFGYQLTTMLRVDPTSEDPTPWIGGIELSTGATAESVAANRLIDLAAHTTPVLDLVIADRGYTNKTSLAAKVHAMHGDLVMDLDRNQHNKVVEMDCGAINMSGAAYDPALPTRLRHYPRRTVQDPVNEYLTERERLLGPYLLKMHTPPDVHSNHRLQGACQRQTVRCTQHPRLAPPGRMLLPVTAPDRAGDLPICTQTTVAVSRDDYTAKKSGAKRVDDRMDLWQPLPYGTWEWAQVYMPWRSRIEGVLGTLTEHHGLWGGRHGFKTRKHPTLILFAIAAAVAFNLTRQGAFTPDHGTLDCRDDAQLDPPREARDRVKRLLARRSKQRQNINPATCGPNCAPVTVNGGGADPPAN